MKFDFLIMEESVPEAIYLMYTVVNCGQLFEFISKIIVTDRKLN